MKVSPKTKKSGYPYWLYPALLDSSADETLKTRLCLRQRVHPKCPAFRFQPQSRFRLFRRFPTFRCPKRSTCRISVLVLRAGSIQKSVRVEPRVRRWIRSAVPQVALALPRFTGIAAAQAGYWFPGRRLAGCHGQGGLLVSQRSTVYRSCPCRRGRSGQSGAAPAEGRRSRRSGLPLPKGAGLGGPELPLPKGAGLGGQSFQADERHHPSFDLPAKKDVFGDLPLAPGTGGAEPGLLGGDLPGFSEGYREPIGRPAQDGSSLFPIPTSVPQVSISTLSLASIQRLS